MQTTKLNLVLAEPDVPVPDTGHFSSSTNAAGNIIAMVFTVAILSIIVGIVLYRLYKAKKLKLLLPVFVIFGLATATFSSLINTRKYNAFAADSYATIEVPEQVDMNGEIKESTFTSSKVTITKPDATNYGYALYILANEANDDLNFIPKTETNETVITSIEQEGALAANTYGFRLVEDAEDMPTKDNTWRPLSSLADELVSYTTATDAGNTTEVYFGILTDNTVTPDTYTLDIDFYALIHPINVSFQDSPDMQNIDPSYCGPIAKPVIDARDNETYLIQRLADGNCWMLDNLRFSDPNYAMTSDDTNITSGRTYRFPNPSGVWLNDETEAYISDSEKNTIVQNTGVGSGKVGTHYNRCAASAGTFCQESVSSDTSFEESVCPAGWRIPSSSGTNNNYINGAYLGRDWENISTSYNGSSTDIIAALSLVPSGEHSTGTPSHMTSYLNENGFYHTSRVIWFFGGASAMPASLVSDTFYAADLDRGSAVGGYGYSIRCMRDENVAVTFRLENIQSITINGVTINGGGSVSLRPGWKYLISNIIPNPGYMFDSATVTIGDSALSDMALTIGRSNALIDITGKIREEQMVTFTFSNISQIVVDEKTINTSGGSVVLTGGETYQVVATLSNANGSMNDPTITSGTGYSISNINGNRFDLTVGSTNGTINIGASTCVAAGTLVTMGDGSKRPIEDIKSGDIVMTWSFWNGRYEPMPVTIAFNHGEAEWNILTLRFSDGTSVRTINQHGFFDLDTNTYSYITPSNVSNYVGHHFVKRTSDGSNEEVTLVGYYNNVEYTGSYSLLTAYNDNFIVQDILSITGEPDDQIGRFEYFTIGNNMKYDEKLMNEDIAKYGLYMYDEWSDYMDEATFEAVNGKYFKVLVGRGIFTKEDIINIIYNYL